MQEPPFKYLKDNVEIKGVQDLLNRKMFSRQET